MTAIPHPQLDIPEFESILASWAISADLHKWNPSATDQEIDEAERELGRKLPLALRALYQMSNGMSLFDGNIEIVPLRSSQVASASKNEPFGLVNYSEQLRTWKWPVPEEVVTFGGDGSDSLFGIWLPKGTDGGLNPIVEIGEVFEPNCMAIAGTDICRFLKSRTTLLTIMLAEEENISKKALQVLDIPDDLWDATAEEDEVVERISSWVDPELPDFLPDPYERGLNAEQIRAKYGPSSK